MAVFRGKMLDALRRAFARDALGLPEAMRPHSFLIFSTVSAIRRRRAGMSTSWNAMPTGPGGDVLARYLRGGPLKNARLVAYDGDCVTFTSRARQEEADAGPALSPTEDVARGGLSATVAPPCPGAPEARCGATG